MFYTVLYREENSRATKMHRLGRMHGLIAVGRVRLSLLWQPQSLAAVLPTPRIPNESVHAANAVHFRGPRGLSALALCKTLQLLYTVAAAYKTHLYQI